MIKLFHDESRSQAVFQKVKFLNPLTLRIFVFVIPFAVSITGLVKLNLFRSLIN
jgi:hypothetical protein